ncbi:MAG: alcohol dehydrogenase catalytic domain-containing protein [Deltaproteobacteria bacterium]|nr:alcohol dehydrogenase catalytic domain-containing protein [Deltaproteobacteria bacterium]
MQALWFDGDEPAVVDRPEPERGAGYALIRPSLAGICNTDLEIVRGYLGFRGILGHELVGQVVQGPDRWVGRRVVSEINFACGSCPMCQQGLGRHCPTRTVMGIAGQDGAFAELVAVPVANLHAVPDEVSDEHAVFAEPLAAAFEILEQLDLGPGVEVTVLGDGKLGLLCAQVVAGSGAAVLAVGHHAEHLAILRDRGIDTALLDQWDHAARDVVVEATGTLSGFTMAVGATRPRGSVVLKSTLAAQATVDLAPLVIDEISVVGSRCGPFAPALEALATRRISVAPLVVARYPLAEGVAALERAARPGTLKVVLEM